MEAKELYGKVLYLITSKSLVGAESMDKLPDFIKTFLMQTCVEAIEQKEDESEDAMISKAVFAFCMNFKLLIPIIEEAVMKADTVNITIGDKAFKVDETIMRIFKHFNEVVPSEKQV